MKRALVLLFFVAMTFGVFAGGQPETAAPTPAATATAWEPTRPVTFVTHVAPGGGMDVATRLFLDIAREYTNATFVVENITGGATIPAAQAVLDRPADGYTVFAMAMSNVNSVVSGGFDQKLYIDGFYWLAKIQRDPAAVIIKKSDRDAGMDFKKIIDQARTMDGRQKWAVPVLGGNKHFEALMIWQATGVKGTAVPFQSGPLGAAALLSGAVEVQMGNPFDTSGRALWVAAIASPQRMPGFEDSPTFAELGYPELNDNHIWRGFAVKKGTPPGMIKWMENLVTQVSKHPRWIEYNASNAIAPRAVFGEDFMKIVRNTIEVTEFWLKQLGM
jgi:tripartite-type tricarboxylate transporter receptor subunit TctC